MLFAVNAGITPRVDNLSVREGVLSDDGPYTET